MIWLLLMASIWNNEPNASYSVSVYRAPQFLTAPQQLRWERLRQCRLLFEGHHRLYYLDEYRTQFDYPPSLIQGREAKLYLTFNLMRLISLKTADLLFGAKAKIDAPTPTQTDRLDELARRSLIHSRFHTAAVQASWAGGAFLESMLRKGEGYVNTIAPDDMYPVGVIGPNGQYDRYVRFATANIGTVEKPVVLLLETTFDPGVITRKLWRLDENGKRDAELQLASWPDYAAAEVPPPQQSTGIAENLITYVPNTVGEQLELSDYDGLVELQDSVNAKFAQVARVLAKHADPKLAAPETSADEKGNLRASAEVFFYRTIEDVPRYITWSAELAAALQDRDSAIDAECIGAEVSQVLLGIQRGAAPESARKLRLSATNTLAKVGRKALLFEPSIALCLATTQKLDQTSSFGRQYPVDAIGVEMRDGLPTDPLDDANEVAALRGAGVMSIEDAVDRRVEDPDAKAAEVARIKQEDAEKMPTVLGGLGGSAGESGTPAPAQDQTQQQKEAA
jgi:hypothetical protein